MADNTAAKEPRPSRARRRPSAAEGFPKPDEVKTPPRGDMRKVRETLIVQYVGLAGIVNMVGTAREDAGLRGTAVAIVAQAESAADSWLEVAGQNPAVKRALLAFAEGSAFAGLATAHLFMLLPLLADRGVLPASIAAMAAAATGQDSASENGDSAAP